jgi:hypothetical protein
MTRVIWVFILLALAFCGWRGYKYWESYQSGNREKETVVEVRAENLPGIPPHLHSTYQAARDKGPNVMREWLKVHGDKLKDPAKGWIELDFCVAVYRYNPSEARRIFNEVKERTQESSPVWPRVKEMERTFQ